MSVIYLGSNCKPYFHQTVAMKATASNKTRFQTTNDLKDHHLETWVSTLPVEHREQLMLALKKTLDRIAGEPVGYISMKELVHVGTFHALPYIGFGFLDNFVMIITGDYIELYFAVYGLSTMAAAGIGNAISDACGIGSAYYVEALSKKLGFPEPVLKPDQTNARRTTWAINIGRVVGVILGCALGMVPLMWRKEKKTNKCETCVSDSKQDTNEKSSKETGAVV